MKKFLLPLLLVLTAMPLSAQTFFFQDIKYKVTSKKNMTCEVCGYKKQLSGDVEIPSKVKGYTVTGIGSGAFEECSLISIKIPNTVTSIGYMAFYNSEWLIAVDVPNSVTSIEKRAFSGCKSLTSVVIPNSVTSIEFMAFYGCKSLTSVVIPNTVTSIKYCAFNGCKSLTSVVIPNSVTSIELSAFSGCNSLKTIIIPNSVARIEISAFSGCNCSVFLTNSDITFIGDPFKEFKGKLFYPKGLRAQTACANKEEIDGDNLEQVFLANALMTPFIKTYVENRINRWQEKGEFEKTADWQARVTQKSREAKAREYMSEAVNIYMNDNEFTLGDYDADNETYLVEGNKFGRAFLKVPMSDAKSFKEQWESFTKTPEYSVNGNNVTLASLTIGANNGPSYRYTNQDEVEYATTRTEFNFAPIDLGLASAGGNVASPAEQNIGSRIASVGGDNTSVSDVDVNIPRGNRTADRTFAVIVANEQYQYASAVDYAINDGIVFSKYCNLTLGIPEKNILLYKNATFGNMRKALIRIKEISEALGGDLDVIFYYAGHGLPDEKTRDAYLLPVDSEGSMLETCIKTSSLYNSLKSTGARRVTVLMDACFSGSERGEGMLASARGVRLNVKMDEVPGRMVVLTAAQGDETAYPYKEKSHGLFTYYLLKKLQETSGKVSLGELADYLTSEVNKESVISNGRKQTPSASPSAEASDWRQWRL